MLVIALAVDVLKPATLGFVMPGMTHEYEISKQTAGVLALVALTGTTVGSVLWGRHGRRLRAARGDPAVGADVHRHRDLRRDAGLRLEPRDVLPDGRLGRRPAADHLHADGRNRAGRAPRLAAGGAGRRRHLGRLPAGGRLGRAAGAGIQLARAVAAGPADRAGHHLPGPLHPRVAALPVQRRARRRGARGARALRRRGGAAARARTAAAAVVAERGAAAGRPARSCCAAAMRASPGA